MTAEDDGQAAPIPDKDLPPDERLDYDPAPDDVKVPAPGDDQPQP